MNGTDRIRVIYISGAGRSGSTLLARMLGQIPGLVSIGELRHFLARGYMRGPEDVRCGCGKPFSECPLWTEVRQLMGQTGWDVTTMDVAGLTRSVDRIRYVARLLLPLRPARFEARYRKFMRFLTDTYRSIAAAGGGSIVVDASKDLSLLYLLALEPAVDLSVLHLVRDSRGVAHSWTRLRRKPEFTDKDAFMEKQNPIYSAIDWDVRNAAAEMVRLWSDRYVRVRYEDLVSMPRETLGRILKCLEVEGSPDFLNGRALTFDRICHISAGNPNRFQRGEIELRLDTAWRDEMPAASRSLVSFLSAPLRWRYRYH